MARMQWKLIDDPRDDATLHSYVHGCDTYELIYDPDMGYIEQDEAESCPLPSGELPEHVWWSSGRWLTEGARSAPERIGVREAVICKSPGGFGMWQRGEYGELMSREEWQRAILDQGYDYSRLGEDDLPDGVEDIRGHIYGQPTEVYAILDREGELLTYCGLREEQIED